MQTDVNLFAAGISILGLALGPSRAGPRAEPVESTSTGGGRWAVVIGVDEYSDPEIAPLAGAVADADAIAGALSRYARFPSRQVVKLTSASSEKPTGAAIVDAISELKTQVKPTDLLLFFFAGHGVEMEGRRYLLAYDSSYESEGTLKRTGLPVSQVMQEIQLVPVAHRIVMVDACRDDPINPRRPLPKATTEALEALFTLQTATEEGVRANFLSSKRGQSAYEWREKGRGFFSYFIEQGLSGQAAVAGRVTITSLYGYLNERVPRAVRAQRGKEQTPFISVQGEELVLVDGVASARRDPLEEAGTRTVFGMVKDSNGRPVAAAPVRMSWAVSAARGPAAERPAADGLVAIADDDGFFKAEVPRGATVTISSGGASGLGLGSVISSPDDSGKKISLFLPRSISVQSPRVNQAHELAKVAYQFFVVEEFAEAEQAARGALEHDPRNALALAVLANCFGVRGINDGDQTKLANGRRLAETVLGAQPQMALAHNALGLSLYGSGDLQGAQAEFSRALELEPSLSVAGANLGQIYLRVGQYRDAERAFRAAIRARPEAALPYNQLAQVLLAQGRARDGVRAALDAISRYELQDRYLGLFYVNLGAALYESGNGAAALEASARARALGVTENPTLDMIERSQASRRRR